MTEFEHALLFSAFLEAQNVLFANYMTMVFAMLTASYFLAKKLSRSMMALFLLIYTLWSLNMIQAIWAAFGDFARLGVKISAFGDNPDTDLGWIGPVYDSGAVSYMSVLPNMMAGMGLVVFAASVGFFFVVRFQKT